MKTNPVGVRLSGRRVNTEMKKREYGYILG
jgi:hypothetical protein